MTFLSKAQFEELSPKWKHSLSYQELSTTTSILFQNIQRSVPFLNRQRFFSPWWLNVTRIQISSYLRK